MVLEKDFPLASFAAGIVIKQEISRGRADAKESVSKPDLKITESI